MGGKNMAGHCNAIWDPTLKGRFIRAAFERRWRRLWSGGLKMFEVPNFEYVWPIDCGRLVGLVPTKSHIQLCHAGASGDCIRQVVWRDLAESPNCIHVIVLQFPVVAIFCWTRTYDSWWLLTWSDLHHPMNDYLVGGWPTPLKNMKVSWDDYSQYMEKKNVPNHQPVTENSWVETTKQLLKCLLLKGTQDLITAEKAKWYVWNGETKISTSWQAKFQTKSMPQLLHFFVPCHDCYLGWNPVIRP